MFEIVHHEVGIHIVRPGRRLSIHTKTYMSLHTRLAGLAFSNE